MTDPSGRAPSQAGNLVEQLSGTIHLGHRPEHVTAIHVDRTRPQRVVQKVGRHGVVGAIKKESDNFALAVESGRAGIAARGINRG